MELSIVNIKGEAAGTIEVQDSVFNQPMNNAVVHQAQVMYNANQRQGTQSARTRGEVSGGGRKPWRQKYTGHARQGSNRAPQWRHGGIVFAPKPRDWRLEMPKQMRRLALRSVLSEKTRQGALVVLDSFSIEQPSTKQMAQALETLGVKGSALLVTAAPEPTVIASARNIERVRTLPVSLLNAAELLKVRSLIMTVDAVKRAEELWGTGQFEPAVQAAEEPAKAEAAAVEPAAVEAEQTAEPEAKKPRRSRKTKAKAEETSEATTSESPSKGEAKE